MDKTILNMQDVSEMTGVSMDTLRFWRHRGDGPHSFKLGRRVAYMLTDVTQWIDEQRTRAVA